MAYFGISQPVIAKYDPATNTYSDGMKLAKAVGTSVTPEYAEGSLYADNAEAEHKKMFKSATVEAEVDTIPLKAGEILFGHSVTEKDSDSEGGETSNIKDSAGYVGYGFVGMETVDGKDFFTACWLPKILFAEGADSFTTAGENIVFNSQKLSGKAFGDKNGDWRIKEKFTDEAKAYAFLEKKANITSI